MALFNIAKDAAIYGSADMIGKLIAFITFPLIAAALSPADFGVLELAMTSVGFFSLLIGCGLNNAVQRFYWDNDKPATDGTTIISSGFFIQIILGLLFILIAGILFFFAVNHLNIQKIPLSTITLLALLFLTPATQWLQFIQDITRLRFMPWRFLSLSLFVKSLGAILSLIAVIVLHQGIDGYITTQFLVVLVALPIGLIMIKDNLTTKIDKTWCKDLAKFGYPFVFVVLAYWLFGSMDRWMLASMNSIDDAGIYSVSFRFSSLVLFVSSAFGLAWSPHSMKIIMNNRERYPEICGIVLLFLLYIMLAVGGGLALFSGELIGLIMPLEYSAAALPLAILCFGIVLQSTTQITAVGISLSKQTRIFAYLAWFTALINFIGNWFLIKHFGPTGAAITTAFSYFILTISYLFFTQRLEPIKVYWKPMLWLIFLGTIVASVSFQYNSLEINWITMSYKTIFSIIMLLLGISALPIKKLKMIA